jgi:hypothetical protein
MANDDKRSIPFGNLRKLAGNIQRNSDDLYRSTYYSDRTNQQQLNAIKTDINASIKSIIDTNADNVGEPNISKLFERMYMNKQNDPATVNEFERIFGDNEFVNNLTSSYLDNRWVRAIDQETDEVLKYMPKLHEALMTIKDNVLSADSFSKDYLNLENDTPTEEYKTQFARNVEDLKKTYDLEKLTGEIYDEISKYGECFYYCVPYSKAIQRLLNRKNSMRSVVVRADYQENAIFIEGADVSKTKVSAPEDFKIESENLGLNVTFTIEEGLISSIVNNEMQVRDKLRKVNEQSLTEQYFREQSALNEGIVSISNYGAAYAFNNIYNQDIEQGAKLPTHHNFDITLDDDLELPQDDEENTAADGLVSGAVPGKINDMNGCIVKKLKRERITPIIINDISLGYYYFEFDQGMDLFDEKLPTTGMVNTITGLRSNGRAEAFDAMQRREELLKNVAAGLAEKIDTKFVDNNQDLKKEIYYILKYNDQFSEAVQSTTGNNIRVTYIPPEDIQHFYFKLDEDTKRGISDLQLSLIPAKLWVAIYITNCLAIMTRGNDKRVYYVRQSVEQNISKTLLKTINEIKKSNFGIRQIENINSVLNITGRFNDYIIPRGQDGQSPVEFEVMQGQNIEIKTELLNLLEESAINVTGVPIEIINSRQSPDYAMQLTMSNSKFLRFVYSRQAEFQTILSRFFTKLYDIEYGTNDRIKLTLPPPLFINVTNTNQLIINTNDYCNNIVEIVMANEPNEAVKQEFAKQLKIYHLGSYINLDVIKEIANKARQTVIKDEVSNPENMGGED